MDQTVGQQWQQQQYDVGGAMANEDFSTFLNLENIDDLNFDFSNLGDPSLGLQPGAPDQQQITLHEQQQHHQQAPLQHDPNVQMADFTGLGLGLGQFEEMQTAPTPVPQQYRMQPQQQQTYGTPKILDFGAQQQFPQHNQHTFNQGIPIQDYRPQPPQQHYSVPPTPNSAKTFSTQFAGQHSMYNSPPHFQMNNVPNSAPVEIMTNYSLPAYAMSPLGSPAIFPQNNGHHSIYNNHPHTADSSLTSSPAPMDLNGENHANDISVERPRKTRKKATPQSVKSKAIASASRKSSLSGTVDNIDGFPVSNISQQTPQISQMTNEQTRSAMSPRPASADICMAPPSKPVSSDGSVILPSATPASIMKRNRPQSQGGSAAGTPYMTPMIQQQNSGTLETPVIASLGPGLEDLHLPDAFLPPQETMSGPAPPRILNGNKAATPMMLPKLTSVKSTPQAEVFQSPSIANLKEGGRNSRKRNSTGSALVSPALRPKISPSIKPLLPDGHGVTSDTHALLLASKSNYQNLIEGNTLPGVSYPADLSMNLTSKRTSHKIAEQGRRNRINTALQELAALIPANFSATKDGSHSSGDGEGSPDGEKEEGGTKSNGKATTTPTNQSSSKAATVEQATAYIKVMQAEKKEMEALQAKMKEELEALKAAKTQ